MAWTEHTSHRFGGLREPHPRFARSKVAFHTKNAPAKRVAQLAEGTLFPSFSVVTGTGPLNQKLRTQFVNIATVLEDENNPDAEGTDVLLGTASNKIERVIPVFFKKDEIGRQLAFILPAALVPMERRDDFPHGPEFTKGDAPALAAFFARGYENDNHLVALPPVAHLNNWGVEDVAGGKITDDVIQSFGDIHGDQGQHWLAAQLAYSPDATKAVLANKDSLTTHLPKIIATRMARARPVQMSVGVDDQDRLEEGLEALDARIATTIGAGSKDAGSGVPDEIGGFADASLTGG